MHVLKVASEVRYPFNDCRKEMYPVEIYAKDQLDFSGKHRVGFDSEEFVDLEEIRWYHSRAQVPTFQLFLVPNEPIVMAVVPNFILCRVR